MSGNGAPWRVLLEPEGSPGAVNMAADQALLDDAARSGTATLRLYRWNPPCLSFGRNEPATVHYDRTKLERLGIDVVRRPTGGRAVWHEHEVTYAVAAPIETFGSLRAAYQAIHERIAAALRSMRADATLAPKPLTAHPPNRLTACFATAVGGEILVRGRKLVGSAQVRKGAAFLQHGSILLAGSQEMIEAVSLQASVVSNSTTLSDVLGRPVTFEEVANAVVNVFADRLTAASSDRQTAVVRDRLTAASSDRRSTRPPLHPTAWTWRR